MITDQHFSDLEDKGYTIVSNAISKQDCDQAIAEYKQWLTHFGTRFPKTYSSIIKDYNIGHQETTWRLRLKTRPVFEQLWKTEKLLTSFDAVAIGQPPDDGHEEYQTTKNAWLHADTTVSRPGLHAYEGALFLEEQTKQDATLIFYEGSHKHIHDYLLANPTKAELTIKMGKFKALADDIEYLARKKCRAVRLTIPKGAMVLWDNRLVWANAKPLPNRKSVGRWRYVVFVSMTPAIWAREADVRVHKEAYTRPAMTNHWSSQGVQLTNLTMSPGIPCPTVVPEVARSDDSLKLSAMMPYDFNDGKPNGDQFKPIWKKYKHDLPTEMDMETKFANGHI